MLGRVCLAVIWLGRWIRGLGKGWRSRAGRSEQGLIGSSYLLGGGAGKGAGRRRLGKLACTCRPSSGWHMPFAAGNAAREHRRRCEQCVVWRRAVAQAVMHPAGSGHAPSRISMAPFSSPSALRSAASACSRSKPISTICSTLASRPTTCCCRAEGAGSGGGACQSAAAQRWRQIAGGPLHPRPCGSAVQCPSSQRRSSAAWAQPLVASPHRVRIHRQLSPRAHASAALTACAYTCNPHRVRVHLRPLPRRGLVLCQAAHVLPRHNRVLRVVRLRRGQQRLWGRGRRAQGMSVGWLHILWRQ